MQFRFQIPCRYRADLWPKTSHDWDSQFKLPALDALEDRPGGAEVAACWSEEGLAFQVLRRGKKKPPWCRDSRIAESDGLHVWLDTRPTADVHRATRYCHHFVFLPAGGGKRLDQPVAGQLKVARAKEDAVDIDLKFLAVRSESFSDGYRLDALIKSSALQGFAPKDQPRLGFTFLVIDAECGETSFCLGSELPFAEDPSLWSVLELIKH